MYSPLVICSSIFSAYFWITLAVCLVPSRLSYFASKNGGAKEDGFSREMECFQS